MATKWKNSRPIKKPDESFRQMHEAHARPLPEKTPRRLSFIGWPAFLLTLLLLLTAAGSGAGLLVLGEAEGLSIQQIDQDSQAASFDQTNAYHKFASQKLLDLLNAAPERVYYNSQLYADYQNAESEGVFANIEAQTGEAYHQELERIAKEQNILLPDDAWDQNYEGADGLPLGTDTSGGLVASGIRDGDSISYFDFADGMYHDVTTPRDILYRIVDNGKTWNENTTDPLQRDALPEGFTLWLSATLSSDGTFTMEGIQDGTPLSQERLSIYNDELAPNVYNTSSGQRVVTMAMRPESVLGGELEAVASTIGFAQPIEWVGTRSLLFGILCLVVTAVFAPGKVMGDRFWARVTGAVALEIKIPLLLGFCLLGLLIPYSVRILSGNPHTTVGEVQQFIVIGALMCYYYTIVAYFFINDLWNFTFDKYSFIRNAYRRGAQRRAQNLQRTPLQQVLVRQFRPVEGIVGALALVAGVIFLIAGTFYWNFFVALLAAAGVAVVFVLFSHYKKQVDYFGAQMSKLGYQLEKIRAGESPAPIELGGCEQLTQAGKDLNAIQDGIENAIEDRMKSERLKVELITNVSHDLKTPLTSIISYVDLLQQEDLSPAARDYVNILAQKSNRLKTMVLDVFDVSKAATGNLPMTPKVLDFGKLLRQTLADMDAAIAASPVQVRAQIPETPVYVFTDGDRMYRVFQNLLQNALQYSLEDSRVYLTLSIHGTEAVATVRNTSKYEIGDVDALLERFVRGDKNRSTSGSGLGLSIAQTFTQACGGRFRIFSQADLFTAEVKMPLTNQTPQPLPGSAEGGKTD